MPHDTPNLDDVLEATEPTPYDRREHAKTPPRPDDEELERRVESERGEVGLDPQEEGGLEGASEEGGPGEEGEGAGE